MVERAALDYTFAAYAAVFLILFAFVLRVHRQTRSLMRELKALQTEPEKGPGRDASP